MRAARKMPAGRFHARPGEIRRFLNGPLDAGRTRQLAELLRAVGLDSVTNGVHVHGTGLSLDNVGPSLFMWAENGVISGFGARKSQAPACRALPSLPVPCRLYLATLAPVSPASRAFM